MGSQQQLSTEKLAEREGFEPPIPVKVYTLSRRAPSATRPSLRTRWVVHHDFIREAVASNFPAIAPHGLQQLNLLTQPEYVVGHWLTA
jgi:hypothetical protein